MKYDEDERAARVAAADSETVAARPRTRPLGLCAVTNFVAVRRALGEREWDQCVDALIDRMTRAFELKSIKRIAPDCVEFEIEDASPGNLRASLQAIIADPLDTIMKQDCTSPRLMLAVGVARPTGAVSRLALLEQAEVALAEACKGSGLVITDVAKAIVAVEELALLPDLRGAAERGEMFLLYQPKINVRDRRVASAEALIRWLHPTQGLIMPDSFIDLADESGDIIEMALWTLERALADQKALTVAGHDLRLFINISGRLLTDQAFIDAACTRVQQCAGRIGFEITETSVIRDPDLAIANLERCAAVGITLAIDDYGSGLSSLSYLKRLPARELKIDKQFVTELTSSHRDPLIVRSTIDLAHALDMEVTAEGVETPAALALLTVMGCEMVQGYLISPPLPITAFQSYLDDYMNEIIQVDVPTVRRPASFWKSA